MKAQPVEKCIQVLRLFSSQNDKTGIGANEICRLTGCSRNKQPIYLSIKFLEKAKVIETKKSRHSQKKPKYLTNLGMGLRIFMNDIENIERSYTEFIKILSEHRVRIERIIQNAPTISSTLSERKATDFKYLERKIGLDWDIGIKRDVEPEKLDKKEKDFLKLSAPVHSIENIYQQEIYNSLVYRYKDILTKFEPNDYAKKLIIRIVLDEIESQLSRRTDTGMVPIIGNDGIIYIRYAGPYERAHDVFGRLQAISGTLADIHDKNIWIKTRNLISCLLNIIKPDPNYVRWLIEENPDLGTEEIDTFNIRHGTGQNIAHIFIQLFREYLKNYQ